MINGKTTPLLEEVIRLCPNVFAIIDSEKKSESDSVASDRVEFAANCAQLKINCLITQKRATENYLSESSVNEAFGGRFAPLGDYDRPGTENSFWGKSENWRAAQVMTNDELVKTDLGKFLAAL